MGIVRQAAGVLGVALACSACGGEDDDDGVRASGTVTAEWAEFCAGTFTEDYQVIDPFDYPLFRAKKGETYLLSEYGDTFGAKAQMLYLWPEGPEPFTIEVETAADFPFSTSCPFNTAARYYAVFEDTAVYAEEALTTKLCDLEAGTALPLDTGSLAGHFITSLELFGPNVFEVNLNVFAAECGAEKGYVEVQQSESFDANTWFVPIQVVLHP